MAFFSGRLKGLWVLLWSINLLFAQNMEFGKTFSKEGELIEPDSVFFLSGDRLIVAVKLVSPVPLPSETLYVLVRDHEKTVGRFYMKRGNKTPLLGYALLELNAPAIYRVFVYDPGNRRFPIARSYLFVTSEEFPTPNDLIKEQIRLLVEKGVLPPSYLTQEIDFTQDVDMTQLEQLENILEEEEFETIRLDQELFGEVEEEQNLRGVGITEEDFSGPFISYDKLDDEFDFEIKDF